MTVIIIKSSRGTSHFPSRFAAAEYYEPYEPGVSVGDLLALVEHMIETGQIHIGKPPTRLDERVRLVDEKPGQRYYIDEFAPVA